MDALSPLDSISDEIAAKFDTFQAHPDTASELRADLDQGKSREQLKQEATEIPLRSLPTKEPAAEEEETEEASTSEETQESADSTGDSTEEDDEQINTLAELASVYEVDESEFAEHLQIQGPDGELHSLQEALTAFRDGPSENEAASTAVAAHVAEHRAKADEHMAQLLETTKHLLVHIDREERVDWAALKESDPVGYIDRREQLDRDRADTQRAFDAFNAEDARRVKEDEDLLQERRKAQARVLLGRMPKWRDEKVREEATADMQQYMQANGFEDGDFDSLVDANRFITVWKAAQFDKLQAKIKKPGAIKRLRGIPTRKSLAATARSEAPAADAGAKQKRQGKVDSLRNSGNEADFASLMQELL